MFDIDGTLTRTNTVDTDCFVAALREIFQISEIDTDWSTYRHATDQGCLEEILQKYRGSPGSEDELMHAKQRFVELLRERADSDIELFRPIPGAIETLTYLRGLPDVAIALATGAWFESAQTKLLMAGVGVAGIPIATCDDSLAREEIMRIAERRAKHTVNVPFRTKTYVGDAVWDVQASSNLDYNFIGVGSGIGAEHLKAKGAKWIVPDLDQAGAFLSILEEIWAAEPADSPDSE